MRVTVDRDLDVCQSGAVEILGLHATVAPRRQQAQTPPTLEHFQFIPYIQNNISESDTNLKTYTQDLLGFIKLSLENIFSNGVKDKIPNSALFKHALEELKNNNAFSIDKYMGSDSYSFINMLHEIFKQEHNDQFFTNAINVRKTHEEKLKHDILLAHMFEPKILKPILDLALENSKSMTKLKVIEVYSGTEIALYSKVIPLLNSQPMLNIDYTVTGLNLDRLDELEMKSLDVKSVPYDFLKSTSSVPSQLSNADLIILNNIVHKKENIPELLQELRPILKTGGFLLVTDSTYNHVIPLVLEGIDKDLGRSRGPFYTEEEIQKQVTSNNLQVVQKLSDKLLSCTFLCRSVLDLNTSSSSSCLIYQV